MKYLFIKELDYKSYPTAEVARGLGVSDETIKRYIRDGKLKSVKIGKTIYVPLKALEEFLEGGYGSERHYKSNGKKEGKKNYLKRLWKQ